MTSSSSYIVKEVSKCRRPKTFTATVRLSLSRPPLTRTLLGFSADIAKSIEAESFEITLKRVVISTFLCQSAFMFAIGTMLVRSHS